VTDQAAPELSPAERRRVALQRNATRRAERTVARLQEGITSLTRTGLQITGPLISGRPGWTTRQSSVTRPPTFSFASTRRTLPKGPRPIQPRNHAGGTAVAIGLAPLFRHSLRRATRCWNAPSAG